MRGMEPRTPQQIEWEAAQAGLTLTQLLERAKVSASTFHAATRGATSLRPLTVVKLLRAIEGAQ
jgi:hypothetical protein